MSDNSIEPLKMVDGEVLEYKKKKFFLKEMHRDLKDHFEFLDSKADLQDDPHEDFRHPKVLKMWHMAKNANFSEAELHSFKVCVSCTKIKK